MSLPIDSYRISAKHYDSAYAAMKDLVDARFYLELAQEIAGPVLEIGCGTGRVLLPIARAGIEIHGVDNSGCMLDILQDKLNYETPDVRGRVSLLVGDMRDFRLNRKFPLVTIPFRPMQHIYSVEDQVRALISSAAHVAKGGLLAFDVFNPKFERLYLRIGEEQLEAEWSLTGSPGVLVRRYFRKDVIDKINQTFTLTYIFRTFHDDDIVSEELETFKMSYYTYPHLQALFLLAGLEAVAEYGSFAKTPLDDTSDEMIFVLRLRHS